MSENQEIIVISGYSKSKYFQNAVKTGINGYIIKLIEYQQLNLAPLKSVQKLIKFKENILYREYLYELVKLRIQTGIMNYFHEHCDGRRYPYGLTAKKIPPLARIMILEDAFDVVRTSKIYKTQKIVDEAIVEIKKLYGVQFDQEVVNVTLEVYKNIKEAEHMSQIQVIQTEQERFSYFYKEQLTSTYTSDYLNNDLYCSKQILKIDPVKINNLRELEVLLGR